MQSECILHHNSARKQLNRLPCALWAPTVGYGEDSTTGDPMSKSVRAGVIAHRGRRTRSRPGRLRIGHQVRGSRAADDHGDEQQPHHQPSVRAAGRGARTTRSSTTSSDNGIIETPVKRGRSRLARPSTCRSRPVGRTRARRRRNGLTAQSFPPIRPWPPIPPTIIALVSKLTGNVDPAKILEFAPGEIQNLPGYEGGNAGQPEQARRIRCHPNRRHVHQGRRQARHRAEDRRHPRQGRAIRAAAQRRRPRRPDAAL